MTAKEELTVKCDKLRRYCDRNGFGAYLITCHSSFAWLTGGKDVHLLLGNEVAAANLLVTKDGLHLVTGNNELPRMVEEVVGDFEIECHSHAWSGPDNQTSVIKKLAGGRKIAADGPAAADALFLPLAPIQRPLLEIEIGRYKSLGRDAADGLCQVGRNVRRGQTEHEIAAAAAFEMLARGIVPGVILVAADARIGRYKHPIPTNNRIDRYGMVVVCGQRHGLFVSLTRFIHFGTLPREIAERHTTVNRIAAVGILHSKAGTTVGDVFDKICQAYADAGCPDTWKEHHQGGPIGYAIRECLATSATADAIEAPQAFAWNPTFQGAKAEDTIIAGVAGPIVVTTSPNWPDVAVEVAGSKIRLPDVLVRKETA